MSEQVEISQADLLREYIEKKIDEKYDFSKSSYKKKAIKEFVELHLELNTTETKVSKHFSNILKQVGEQKGKSPSEMGIKTPKVNPAMLNASSDMNASIEPRPQGEILQPGGPNQPQIPGQPGMGQPNQPYVNPNMTVESVGALAQGGMAGIKSILPDLELLDDDEKKSIGAILLPPLSRIEDERIQLYLLPILGVLGIIGPKIVKARKIKKERNLKKKQEESQTKQVEEKSKDE